MPNVSFDFSSRTAIVTGAAQGLGLEVSRTLAEAGAYVCLWDSNAVGLKTAADRLAATVSAAALGTQELDVTNPAAVEAATSRVLQLSGRIDILINAAAIVGPIAPLWEYPVDEWDKILRVGLTGSFLCCRSVIPAMMRQNFGRILNVSSIAGKEGNPNASAYSACKAGVIAMTKSLGKEVASYDIAVNCVTPSIADTPGAMGQTAEHIRLGLSKVPRNRYLGHQEAANMFAWIVSEENSFTTGATFDLSGGRATY